MPTAAPIPALLPTYAPYPFPLVKGEGDRVFDDQGLAWWDFYGGHCVCATGHSHPKVVKALADQAASLLFYSAAAALPVNATTAATYTAKNLSFGAPQAPGSIALTITPGSGGTQGTWGELRQNLSTGGTGSQMLIVQSQTAATSLSQDLVAFAGLAPGFYGITTQRSTSGAAPVMKVGASLQAVSSGGLLTPALSYP